MAKNEPRDELDMPVSHAMGCIWWCHLPMATDFRYRESKAEQYKILEFIFGPNTKLKLIDQMAACGEKNPMIGEKLVEYAKLHGYEKELPDDLRDGFAGQDAADVERREEDGE